jgi:hypothetical protein
VASPDLAGGEAGTANHFARPSLAEHGRGCLCRKSVSFARLTILLRLDLSSECHAGGQDANRCGASNLPTRLRRNNIIKAIQNYNLFGRSCLPSDKRVVWRRANLIRRYADLSFIIHLPIAIAAFRIRTRQRCDVRVGVFSAPTPGKRFIVTLSPPSWTRWPPRLDESCQFVPAPRTRLRPAASANALKSRSRVTRETPPSIQV